MDGHAGEELGIAADATCPLIRPAVSARNRGGH